jgi:hypothetical protein
VAFPARKSTADGELRVNLDFERRRAPPLFPQQRKNLHRFVREGEANRHRDDGPSATRSTVNPEIAEG